MSTNLQSPAQPPDGARDRGTEAALRALRLVTRASELSDILETLCRLSENLIDGAMCSVLLLDESGETLVAGAAPSLPTDYATALEGLRIGECAGSCGTAAYYRRPVIVTDIRTDPLWESFRELAAKHGIRACWSMPIFDAEQHLLGTFSVSHRQPRSPRPGDLQTMELATELAGISVARKRTLVALTVAHNELETRVRERTAELSAANRRLREEVERREAVQNELRERENMVRTISDNVPALLSYMDLDLRYRFANQRYEEWFGLKPAEILGKHLSEVVGMATYEAVLPKLESVLEGATESFELKANYLHGGDRWVSVTYAPDFRQNSVVGYYALVTDITAQKQAEAERLAHARRQRDTLIKEVHHRIKNNLQGVVGLLREHEREHPELEGALNKAATQVSAVALVHGLQGERSRDTVALSPLIRAIVQAASTNSRFTVEIDDCLGADDVSLVDTEAVPMALIFNELLTNALKYSEPHAQGDVVITLSRKRNLVRVRIVGGSALPAEFDFSRGTGLGTGLSLVKSLMPPEGARLRYRTRSRRAEAVLWLTEPVLFS